MTLKVASYLSLIVVLGTGTTWKACNMWQHHQDQHQAADVDHQQVQQLINAVTILLNDCRARGGCR
jgi:hypothetical protein